MSSTRVPPSSPDDSRRWVVLAVLALGFVAFTFNWFVMPATFGQAGAEFEVGVPELAMLVSVFVGGYAVMHIPAGMLGTRFGLRAALLAGLALEGLLTALAGWAPNYETLLVLRALAGLAGSVYAGLGIAAVSAWFRGREHALALGVVSASFSVGVGLGLYGWIPVVSAVGWRSALVWAGVVALAVALLVGVVYRTPAGFDRLAGVSLSRHGLRAALAAPALWRFGLAFFVGYGGYFAVAQLIGTYATESGYSTGVAETAALLAGVGGLPGSLLAGWLADRVGGPVAPFVGFLVLEGLGALLIPVVGAGMLWLPALLVGFGFNACFAVWQAIPADVAEVAPEHVGTAIGLMLTIGGVGGFVVPWLFGLVAPSAGYGAAWTMIGFGMLACLGFVATRSAVPRSTPAPAAAD